ncbi:MAG: type II secretion system inner membrane protein GspF [Deltaproteobacteria bacterium]|nr:type II secretion system inner membrane protein GspF [Deltaproteobacteria bacterium]MBN2673460.1 type II secretion system inner membrane protein GspF [Deltaproteobacteria bacterium]
MPLYKYEGIRKSDGKNVKGVLDAESEKALRGLLKRDGIMPSSTSVKGKGKDKNEVDFGRYFNRVKKADIALTTRQLATLTKSGVSLVESLTAVIDQCDKPDLKSAITDVRDQVNQGTSLSDAFSKYPAYFDRLFCNMVHAGEQSGTLEQVLERLADFIEASDRLKNKVVGAMAYPAFMLVVGVVVINILMIVVVPKVTSIFENFDKELPIYTRILVAISDFMATFWWMVLILMVFGIWGFRRWKKTEKGEFSWHRFTLRAPIFGKLTMMVAISRFAKTLATLLSSGVPLLSAMDITKGVLGNVVLEKVVVDASKSIREGESISEPLKASGYFPPVVTHMIAVGERTGQLEAMLENVSSSYDAQVDSKVMALTSILEPLLIVLMGVGAGGIAAAVLLPLVQINEFI